MPRPKQRTPALREHVLQAALTTLAADGIAGFTTRKVAQRATTSVPAVYELFGDRAGLVREMFFEGFRRLRDHFDRITDTDDAQADLIRVINAIRTFGRGNRVLSQLMFSRPFADFDPTPDDLRAGSSTREFIVTHVRRCIASGVVVGNETDIAHVVLALAQGLAAQESAGWLGTSKATMDRRWALAITALLAGLSVG